MSTATKLNGLSVRRVADDKVCAMVMMAMVGIREIKLNDLDLWVKLQGYYFFLDEDERMTVDMESNSVADRLQVTPDALKSGIETLKNLGFIVDLGQGKTRLLRGAEANDLCVARKAARRSARQNGMATA